MKCKYIQAINISFVSVQMLVKRLKIFLVRFVFRLSERFFSFLTFYLKQKSNKFFIVYSQYHSLACRVAALPACITNTQCTSLEEEKRNKERNHSTWLTKLWIAFTCPGKHKTIFSRSRRKLTTLRDLTFKQKNCCEESERTQCCSLSCSLLIIVLNKQ